MLVQPRGKVKDIERGIFVRSSHLDGLYLPYSPLLFDSHTCADFQFHTTSPFFLYIYDGRLSALSLAT